MTDAKEETAVDSVRTSSLTFYAVERKATLSPGMIFLAIVTVKLILLI